MNTPTRLALFALGLAAVFAGATGVGQAVGPIAARSEPGSDARDAVRSPKVGEPVTDTPGGLQVSERGYTLQLPEPTLPEGPWPLAVAVLGPDGHPATAYQTTEGQQVHLVLVRRDLSGYRHLHPRRSSGAAWTAPVALSPGTYRLLAEFHPVGETRELTLGIDFIVPGSVHPGLLPAPSATDYPDGGYPDGGYEVTLDGSLRSGEVSRLTVTARRPGTVATDPQPYSIASGHLVVLRAGDLASLRVHRDGSTLRFDVEVPSPGTYRLYFDFTDRNTVTTAEFTAVAAPPAAPAPTGTGGGHGG